MNIMVAIDGPASAGKGTISSALAEEFNLACMDTGALYRAVAYSMIKESISIDDEDKAIEHANMLGNEISFDILESPALRSSEAGAGSSKVSVIPGVRKALLDCQINFAHNKPDDKYGTILDGRDIGTVICPDADVKLFITASAEVRAERRYKDLIARGEDVSLEKVLQDIQERDARDMGRESAPLRPADDAIIIDTTLLSIEEAISAATEAVINR